MRRRVEIRTSKPEPGIGWQEDQAAVSRERIPPQRIHVACIMDGNGRWATRRGFDRIDGHAAGEAAITAVVDAACEENVGWLTLFAFSTENWDRPQAEVNFLMEFNRRLIAKYGDEYHERGIRIRYLGRREEPVPAVVRQEMRLIEDRTKANAGLTLTFAFNYGGRAEIIDAVRRLLASGYEASEVDEAAFTAHRQFPDMPDPDLIVRTSGEYRLSNFMLWGAAYAELVFLNVLWPDFRASHLREALRVYRSRERRFGALGVPEAPAPALYATGGRS